jgi:hypothetical protein
MLDPPASFEAWDRAAVIERGIGEVCRSRWNSSCTRGGGSAGGFIIPFEFVLAVEEEVG